MTKRIMVFSPHCVDGCSVRRRESSIHAWPRDTHVYTEMDQEDLSDAVAMLERFPHKVMEIRDWLNFCCDFSISIVDFVPDAPSVSEDAFVDNLFFELFALS